MKKTRDRDIFKMARAIPRPVRSYTNTELKEFFDLDKKESENLRKKSALIHKKSGEEKNPCRFS